jgi:hypothetical protein
VLAVPVVPVRSREGEERRRRKKRGRISRVVSWSSGSAVWCLSLGVEVSGLQAGRVEVLAVPVVPVRSREGEERRRRKKRGRISRVVSWSSGSAVWCLSLGVEVSQEARSQWLRLPLRLPLPPPRQVSQDQGD